MVQKKAAQKTGPLTLTSLLLAALLWPVLPPAVRAWGEPVAIIEVPGNPDEQYVLQRSGEQVAPLSHRMEILAGDIVIPKHGKAISLQYLSTGCGRTEITQRTTIPPCQPQAKGTGRVNSSFSRLFDEIFKKTKGDTSHTYTTRGIPGAEEPIDLPLSAWPPEGSTLLAGEKLLFRFLDPDRRRPTPGMTASLVIADPQGGQALLTTAIEPGQFQTIPLEASRGVLIPGQSYSWKVTRGGQDIIATRSFRILTEEASAQIKTELTTIAEAHPEAPLLAQALYLQTKSDEDASSGLNLYADSLRLILSHGRLQDVPAKLINRVQHGPPGSSHDRSSGPK